MMYHIHVAQIQKYVVSLTFGGCQAMVFHVHGKYHHRPSQDRMWLKGKLNLLLLPLVYSDSALFHVVS